MSSKNLLLRPFLGPLFVAASLLLGAAAAGAQPAPSAPSGPSGASAPKGPIEVLVTETPKKLEEAIRKVEDLRKASPGHFADAESEFWAARAEVQLKQIEAARERFLKIASVHPHHARAGAAAIEATTVRLATLEGKAETANDKKLAVDSAKELEATAVKFAKDPETSARAWYVAGNSWRTAGDEATAEKAYAKAAALPGEDYPVKATYMTGILASKRFDTAKAREIYTRCIKEHPSSPSVDKCQKGLSRVSMVGKPAAEFEVETWINGTPVKMADQKGKVVLLWFFATWCPHCKETMPQIAALRERMKSKAITFVGVTGNTKGQTTESALEFVKTSDHAKDFTYPVAVDMGQATTEDYDAMGIPQAVLVDKKGVIRWTDHPTFLTDAMIETLLAE